MPSPPCRAVGVPKLPPRLPPTGPRQSCKIRGGVHRFPAGAVVIVFAIVTTTSSFALMRWSAARAAPVAGFWYEDGSLALPAGAAAALGSALTPEEMTTVKRLSRAELQRSFSGLRIIVTDRRDAFWRVAVVRSLRSRGPLPNAGQSIAFGLLGGSGYLAFTTLAASGMRYAPPGASRQAILDGIARGIRRAAAHEFSHQILGAAAVHSRDDRDSFEYFTSDRASQYYGELHWTTAWPRLTQKVGAAPQLARTRGEAP
jgi:hypothetical protein